jgi:RNA polymerase sigma factor (sigma-70 family)
MNANAEALMAYDQGNTVLEAAATYGQRLFRFIRGKLRSREDAEDVLQEVWYQLSKTVNVAEIEHLSGWLHQVARNKITDRHRKKSESSIESLGFLDEDGSSFLTDILLVDSTTPETEYLKDLFWDELMTALQELPEKQRQVFIWNEMEDQTLQQIADRTGENIKTIISRKGYAVKHLRTRLRTFYQEYLND